MLQEAKENTGASFVEILQNCIVYNDGVYSSFTDKANVANGQILCDHGKPLLFGKDRERGLRMTPGKMELEVVELGKNGVSEADILIHDETNRPLALMLAGMQPPDFPVAMGVIFRDPGPAYDAAVYDQIAEVTKKSPAISINELMHKGKTWTVV